VQVFKGRVPVFLSHRRYIFGVYRISYYEYRIIPTIPTSKRHVGKMADVYNITCRAYSMLCLQNDLNVLVLGDSNIYWQEFW